MCVCKRQNNRNIFIQFLLFDLEFIRKALLGEIHNQNQFVMLIYVAINTQFTFIIKFYHIECIIKHCIDWQRNRKLLENYDSPGGTGENVDESSTSRLTGDFHRAAAIVSLHTRPHWCHVCSLNHLPSFWASDHWASLWPQHKCKIFVLLGALMIWTQSEWALMQAQRMFNTCICFMTSVLTTHLMRGISSDTASSLTKNNKLSAQLYLPSHSLDFA